MKDAVGGSLLLNLVVIFTSIVILFFAGILAYSKAYKVKNKIIEVIERNETYNTSVVSELSDELTRVGYITANYDEITKKCGYSDESLYNSLFYGGHLYCVYLKSCNQYSETTGECIGQRYYEVVTYAHFAFPVIGDMLTFPVKGETRVLGKNYNY